MPFTPFHWGPSLLLGIYTKKYLDFPSLMIATVIVDIEPLLALIGLTGGPTHGFFHTFPGATIAALTVAILVTYFKNYRQKSLELIGFKQSFSRTKVIAGSLVGTYSHVILDSMIYEYINPFYIISGNPFYGHLTTLEVYLLCTLAGILGLLLLPGKLNKEPKEIVNDINNIF